MTIEETFCKRPTSEGKVQFIAATIVKGKAKTVVA